MPLVADYEPKYAVGKLSNGWDKDQKSANPTLGHGSYFVSGTLSHERYIEVYDCVEVTTYSHPWSAHILTMKRVSDHLRENQHNP